MAISTLTFEKITTPSGDKWATKFTSQGSCVIEMERTEQSEISVTASIDGLADVPVASFQNPFGANAIFEIDVAEGIDVTIKSTTEVLRARILS